jgi:HlyD family secretion protein
MNTSVTRYECHAASFPVPRDGGPGVRGGWIWAFPLLLTLVAAGCTPQTPGGYQGYVEGEFVYLASPLTGTLANLAVSRGADVKTGQLLFELEHEAEAAAAREAEERLAQAKARLDNLTKGRRPIELAALEAQLERAKANLRLSELELERRQKLNEGKVISPAELDVAQSRREADQAQVAALTAELETAHLGARVDEVRAAEAEVQAMAATLAKARWALGQKTQRAPTNAWVHDTLYRQGELVAAGNPVVTLLPPEHLKVRFFVPQGELATLNVGQRVSVSWDGAGAGYPATVNYIATQAEFTPPVIYSKETRAKLVFMVEAAFAPTDARNVRPGQPVDVRR